MRLRLLNILLQCRMPRVPARPSHAGQSPFIGDQTPTLTEAESYDGAESRICFSMTNTSITSLGPNIGDFRAVKLAHASKELSKLNESCIVDCVTLPGFPTSSRNVVRTKPIIGGSLDFLTLCSTLLVHTLDAYYDLGSYRWNVTTESAEA